MAPLPPETCGRTEGGVVHVRVPPILGGAPAAGSAVETLP